MPEKRTLLAGEAVSDRERGLQAAGDGTSASWRTGQAAIRRRPPLPGPLPSPRMALGTAVAALGLLLVTLAGSTGANGAPAGIAVVGQATTFASGNTGSPSTGLPAGVAPGHVLVSYIESYPFTTITCAAGWTKAVDVVNGNASRLAGCWRVAGVNEPNPAATVSPPTQVSMVTMAFSGVDSSRPAAAAGAAGLSSPGVESDVADMLLVLGEGSNTWQAVAQAPAGSALGATVNNGANSHVAIASASVVGLGDTGAKPWGSSPATTDAAAGTIALRPASTPTVTTVPVTTTSPSGPPSVVGYPTSPPARICGNVALLDGPSVPPAGAVRVNPGQDLYALTLASPTGTTFWLAPGVHTLGTGQYNQIVALDNDSYIGAPGAVLDGQNLNLFAFAGQARGVTIRNLTIQNFGTGLSNRDEGTVNHDGGQGWTVENSTIRHNDGAGVFLGNDNIVRSNCLTENGQYGFSMYKPEGMYNITLDRNEISNNNVDDWEARVPGCGCTGGGKFWDVKGARVTNNWVHDNKGSGLWADTNAIGFLIEGNYINDNDAEGIFYETSYNVFIHNNTLKRNALVKGAVFAARNDTFPVAAVYLSESGGDDRVYPQYATSEVSGNLFDDNWGGVVLWENADRFCSSAGSTAAGYCPKGGAASPTTCEAGTINNAPYYDDCRWKTQNVDVHDNDFRIDKVALSCVGTQCGQQGIFSNYGTYPAWSPYQGRVVQEAITFNQNNRFRDNHYVGDWHFDAFEPGRVLDLAAWQAAPYGEDLGSTLTMSGDPPTTQPTTSTSTTAPTTTSTMAAPTSTTTAPTTTTTAPTTTTTAPTTTTTTTPPSPANVIDADTAGLEPSVGRWTPWYAADGSRSAVAAHTGTQSLRVQVTEPWGWGVQLNNYPGFPAASGNKTISFWGRLAAPTVDMGATLRVTWRDASGASLQIDGVTIPALGAEWRQGTAAVTAPAGTAWMSVDLIGGAAAVGSVAYFDDFRVAP